MIMVAPVSRAGQTPKTVAPLFEPGADGVTIALMRSTSFVLGLGVLGLLYLGGCAAVHDDMQRAETAYEAARYEDTLVWLVDLEDDAPAMHVETRARYYYLRGMTEYRLGHRANALHYLAVGREIVGDDGAGLRPEWRQIMDRTLAELTPRGMNWRPPEAPTSTDEATSGGESSEDEAAPAADG